MNGEEDVPTLYGTGEIPGLWGMGGWQERVRAHAKLHRYSEMYLKVHQGQCDGGSSELTNNPASNTKTAEIFDV